jgi:putative FmdB family regulatory protein
MPIYEYKCDLCNGLWEEIQKFSDDPLTVCKSCEKEGGVHKLFSGSIAFHLKGGGWADVGYDSKRHCEPLEIEMDGKTAFQQHHPEKWDPSWGGKKPDTDMQVGPSEPPPSKKVEPTETVTAPESKEEKFKYRTIIGPEEPATTVEGDKTVTGSRRLHKRFEQ